MAFRLITLILLLLNFSCSQTVSNNPEPERKKESSVEPGTSFGKLSTIDGSEINLDQANNLGWVIIFASDTCSTCAEEAQYWVDDFKAQGPFKNFQFVSYLIGNQREDALDWKNTYKISWPIVQQSQDRLYRQFCPQVRTPCTVLYRRQDQKILQTYEVLKRSDLVTFFNQPRGD